MKKVLLLTTLSLSILILTSQPSFGQSTVYLGVKGGLSIPNLSAGSSGQNEWNEGYSSIVRGTFGITSEYQISNHFSIQLEASYIGEGGKRDGIQPFPIPEKYLDLFHFFYTLIKTIYMPI